MMQGVKVKNSERKKKLAQKKLKDDYRSMTP